MYVQLAQTVDTILLLTYFNEGIFTFVNSSNSHIITCEGYGEAVGGCCSPEMTLTAL